LKSVKQASLYYSKHQYIKNNQKDPTLFLSRFHEQNNRKEDSQNINDSHIIDYSIQD
jgi:hypothetical protein